MEVIKAVCKVINILKQEKAIKPMALDVQGKTKLAKYLVICSYSEASKNKELANKLMSEIEYPLLQTEGMTKSEWIILDYSDFIIHVLTEQLRQKYNIEKLWVDNNILSFDEPETKNKKAKK